MNVLPRLISAQDNEEEGANWILTYYGEKYEGQFIKDCNDLGYPIRPKKMKAPTAAAMWIESNISMKAQKVILRYMQNEFGTSLVVPAGKIEQFGENHIPPDCNFIETRDRKKINF